MTRPAGLARLTEALLAERPPASTQLRINDALAAFLAGLKTSDGAALARLHRRHSHSLSTVAVICAVTRLSECDDIELASCVTPGAVVIPVALAHGRGRDYEAIGRAICAGYEVGLLLGRAIGGAKAMPKTWPTLFAAPVMAAVTASLLLGTDADRLLHAMSLALAGHRGVAGRPSGAPSGRWIAIADAVQKGVSAACAAAEGFHGDPEILEGISSDVALPRIEDAGYKPYPIARQAATAVEAFRRVLGRGVDPATVQSVTVVVPQMNVALLSRPPDLGDRVSLLCSAGFQLACAALAPNLLYDPERGASTPELIAFSRRVTVTGSDEFDGDPSVWPTRLHVRAAGEEHVEELRAIPLDAGNFDQAMLHDKWRRLLHGEDRRDFFENVVNAPPDRHAMLWDWAENRLSRAIE